MKAQGSLGPVLQSFFVEHLVAHKRVSPRTVSAYRDTFRLLLRFLHDVKRSEPAALHMTDLDAPVILEFLDDLERKRSNVVRSRNARLTAIRSFFRYVAMREPQHLALVARVLAIPTKRADRRLIGYLTHAEIEVLLATPDQSTRSGRRVGGTMPCS